MELEKTMTFAGLVWVAGILALILFEDAFTGSVSGIVLGLILVGFILAASYLILDGIWKIRFRDREQEEVQRQAYEQKMHELLQNGVADKLVQELLQRQGGLDEDKIYELLQKQKGLSEDRIYEILQEQNGLNEGRISKMLQKQNGLHEEKILEMLRKQSGANEEKIAEILQRQSGINEEKLSEIMQKQNESDDRIAELLQRQSESDGRIAEMLQKQSGFDEEMVYELVQDELKQMEKTINDNNLRTAKLLIKYINKTSQETIQRIEELEEEIQ